MLNPDELPLTERKGLLGVVYLRAIAAIAGYGVALPESDYDSIDLIVSSKKGKRQRLEFQIKCTSQVLPATDRFGFELSKKNYDDLRVDTIIPRFLFVLVVPEDMGDWVRQSERRLNLRRCGYWMSLQGLDERSNTNSVTVHVPRSSLLTPEALRSLMNRGNSR
jgi:Domain of unknown function (DUF4365)